MKCICITGPESCGKSELAKALASALDGQVVPEYSRIYLERRGPNYVEADLTRIAVGQINAEHQAWAMSKRPILLDTSLEVMKIWSEEVFGRSSAIIEEEWIDRKIDFYLLCAPDIPWEPDPLRQNPNDRDRLFDRYADLLARHGLPYAEVRGQGSARLHAALAGLKAAGL